MRPRVTDVPCKHCGRLFASTGSWLCSPLCEPRQWFEGEPTVPGSQMTPAQRGALVLQWLGYAWKVAISYYRRSEMARKSMELTDLFQEGITGLLIAAERFDPARGTKFITFAHHWVRQRIARAVTTSSLVTVPPHVVYGCGPTGTAAEDDGATVADADWAARVRKARAAMSVIHLGHHRDQSGARNRFLDTPAPEPDHDVTDRISDEVRVAAALARLDERPRAIIRQRFGIGRDSSGESKTLEAVAQWLGVTKQRVAQIEDKSLATLREWLRDGVDPATATVCKYRRRTFRCAKPATRGCFCEEHQPGSEGRWDGRGRRRHAATTPTGP